MKRILKLIAPDLTVGTRRKIGVPAIVTTIVGIVATKEETLGAKNTQQRAIGCITEAWKLNKGAKTTGFSDLSMTFTEQT